MENKNITGYLYKIALKSWKENEGYKLNVLRFLVYFISSPDKAFLFEEWKENLVFSTTVKDEKIKNFAIELKEKLEKNYNINFW